MCSRKKVDDLSRLSFIQRKSAEIACSLEGYFIKVGMIVGTPFEDPELVSSRLFEMNQ
jgi:hypothetical protein